MDHVQLHSCAVTLCCTTACALSVYSMRHTAANIIHLILFTAGATEQGKKTPAYQEVCARIVQLSQRHNIPVKNFTELRSIEVKGNAQQFYQVIL